MGHTTFASRFARAVIALAVLAGAFASQAAPAAGWANGGGDGYGTHDWIIDQAMRVLDGRVDGWFDAQTARIHSDDPDTIERAAGDQDDHVYHEKGKRGGAIDRIATEFDKAQASYAAGDYEDASYHIGLLSHIYGDILQPYHTAYAAMNRDTEHHNYEQVVAPLTRKASDMPAWQSSRRTVSTFGNIRTKAVASAKYSRSLYPALHKAFAHDQHHDERNGQGDHRQGHEARGRRPGRRDLVGRPGHRRPPQVGSLKVSVRWVGVKSGYHTQWVYVTAKDVDGKPIEDLKVSVAWPTTNGTREEVLYTDPTGSRCARAPSGPRPQLHAARRRRLGHRARPAPAGPRVVGDHARPQGRRRRLQDTGQRRDRRPRSDGHRHVDRPRQQRPTGPQPARPLGLGLRRQEGDDEGHHGRHRPRLELAADHDVDDPDPGAR